MLNMPPQTGDRELDAYNWELHQLVTGGPASPIYNQDTGFITSRIDNKILGFLYRYLHIKFADDTIGTGISDSPSGKLYYGLFNSADSTETSDPTKYFWYRVDPTGFGTDKMFFRSLGGRSIDFFIGATPPDYRWNETPVFALDLDDLVGSGSIGPDQLQDGSVDIEKLNTTGTPSPTTFLNGDFEWIEAQTKWFLTKVPFSTSMSLDDSML